jgi:hypothetical protein
MECINNKGWSTIIGIFNNTYHNTKRECLINNIPNDKGLYFHFTYNYQLEPSIAVYDYNKYKDFCYGGYRADKHNSLDKVTESINISHITKQKDNNFTAYAFDKMLENAGLYEKRFSIPKLKKSELFDFLSYRKGKWESYNNDLISIIREVKVS